MLERKLLALVLLLALSRGLIYAIVLPAWDQNDEEQHYHYVQHLAETWRLPTMGDPPFLSPEILSSVAETDRWWRLGLPRPAAFDPRRMGLEGLSYEAYQPPLYYAVLAVPYGISLALIPLIHQDASAADQTLAKLYILRFLTVMLSVASAALSYAALRQVFIDRRELAFIGVALLLLIPERTMALSRVNNDSMVELLSAATLFLLLRSAHRPITLLSSLLLGLLLGLAVLAKVSALVLVPLSLLVIASQAVRARSVAYLLARAALVTSAVLIVSGWFLVRNLWLYGDLTGAAAFLSLVDFVPKYTLSAMLMALSRAFWATRWSDITLDAFAVLMAVVGLFALAGWLSRLLGAFRGAASEAPGDEKKGEKKGETKGEKNGDKIIGTLAQAHGVSAARVSLLLFAAAIVWVAPLWHGASSGLIQHVEGRFVVAAYAPSIGLLLLGLSGFFGGGGTKSVAQFLAFALAVFDLLYVTRFLLGNYYFREAFDSALFFANKPDFVSPALVVAIGFGYALLLGSLVWAFRCLGIARRIDQRGLPGDITDPQGGGAG